MSQVTYAIVFNGQILEGFQPISVKAHMAKLLKADADKMAALFSGKQVVIKRTADKAEAARYGTALKKVGADIKVKVIKGEAPAAKPAATPKPAAAPAATSAPAATPAPAVPAGDMSLAENVGNIFDAKEPEPAPEIDLSALSVAANDGSPLVAPTDYERADIDLSEYSVADNDGGNLFEHESEDVPEVDVPDFGLDEPGAVLETLKEEVEPVQVNTMGMTLAMAGSDLLEPEERDQGPDPVAPDTSKIHLVPNFG